MNFDDPSHVFKLKRSEIRKDQELELNIVERKKGKKNSKAIEKLQEFIQENAYVRSGGSKFVLPWHRWRHVKLAFEQENININYSVHQDTIKSICKENKVGLTSPNRYICELCYDGAILAMKNQDSLNSNQKKRLQKYLYHRELLAERRAEFQRIIGLVGNENDHVAVVVWDWTTFQEVLTSKVKILSFVVYYRDHKRCFDFWGERLSTDYLTTGRIWQEFVTKLIETFPKIQQIHFWADTGMRSSGNIDNFWSVMCSAKIPFCYLHYFCPKHGACWADAHFGNIKNKLKVQYQILSKGAVASAISDEKSVAFHKEIKETMNREERKKLKEKEKVDTWNGIRMIFDIRWENEAHYQETKKWRHNSTLDYGTTPANQIKESVKKKIEKMKLYTTKFDKVNSKVYAHK